MERVAVAKIGYAAPQTAEQRLLPGQGWLGWVECYRTAAAQLAARAAAMSVMISGSAAGWAWMSPEIWPPHSISIWP